MSPALLRILTTPSYFDLKRSGGVVPCAGGLGREMMASTLGLEGIEAILSVTVGDQASLFDSELPPELLRLPEEFGRVDALLDDSVFLAPLVPPFDPRVGRLSTPMRFILRLMFLKFRYRLGYEALCREVSDSITWRRLCRIPLEGRCRTPPRCSPFNRFSSDSTSSAAIRGRASARNILTRW